jgi:hypothetical protein
VNPLTPFPLGTLFGTGLSTDPQPLRDP